MKSPITNLHSGLPWWLSSKESVCQCRRRGFDPGSGRSLGGGNSNPLRYSCLENPMDGGAQQATIHGVVRVRHDLATIPPPLAKNGLPKNESYSKKTSARLSCKLLERKQLKGWPVYRVWEWGWAPVTGVYLQHILSYFISYLLILLYMSLLNKLES